MPNEFIARNGLIALDNSSISGSLNISSSAATQFRVGTNLFFVSSSGNIGIGTSTPGQLLDINAGSAFTSIIRFTAGNGVNRAQLGFVEGFGAVVGATSGNSTFVHGTNIMFRSNDLVTEWMRITNAGNIGIGITTPSASLHISGASSANLLRVDSPASSSILFVSGSGNIGIGTNTPAVRLHVVATAGADAIHTNGTIFFTDSTKQLYWQGGSYVGKSEHYFGSSNYEWKSFDGTNIVTRMNINASSGNVGVGLGSVAPTARLQVSGSSGSVLFEIDSNSTQNILYVSGSGRVGIGTSNPTASLHIVDGGIGATSSLQVNTSFRVTGDGQIRWGAAMNQGLITWDTGRVMVGGLGSTNLDLTAGAATRARLDTSGNMGIGTALGTISARTHIIGAGATSATTNFLLQNSTPSTLLTILDNGQHTYSGPLLTLASSQSGYIISQSISASNVVGGQYYAVNITPTFFQTTASQTETAFRVAATFTQSSAVATSGSNIIADFGATSVGSQLTVTDITSGSIYMVNDVSGLPIIEATSDWTVNMYNFPSLVFQKTGSQVNINGTLRVSGSFILPLSQSILPQTGSAYWSGSLLFVYDGTRYRSSSFA
jgi:hypothetical protein